MTTIPSERYQFNELLSAIQNAGSILLFPHVSPDGDTLGSSGALCSALRRMGKRAYMYKNPEITEKYLPYVAGFFPPAGFQEKYTVTVDTAEPSLFPKGFSGK